MMHTSQFHKIDSYDWFCAPGSHSSGAPGKLTFIPSLMIITRLTVISERADGPAAAEYDPVRPARPLLENKAGQTDAGAGVRDQS